MYGRRGLVRRRPLLRAAAVGGTFAAGRAMGRRSAEQADAATYRDQGIGDLAGQQQPLLRAGGEGQQQPLLRSDVKGQQDQPLPRAAGDARPHQPLMQAAPPQDIGAGSAADQLSRLAELHLQGKLTDDEFAAAKAITLGRG
jgi:hypothetical protein